MIKILSYICLFTHYIKKQLITSPNQCSFEFPHFMQKNFGTIFYISHLKCLLKYFILFSVYACFACIPICASSAHSSRGDQKRAWEPPELEL